MLRRLNRIEGFALQATDGEIGKVQDFYFDDHRWVVRYMVANTGNWLVGQRVLISPASLGEPQWDDELLPVNLTCEQIRSSPPIETEQPVSRQKESMLAEYYGWPMYWTAGYVEPYPRVPATPAPAQQPARAPREHPDLRSCREVSGYRIHAEDGEIGHLEDYIVQTSDWGIRYLIVDTRNWLPGRKVLVSPLWIGGVSWPREELFVKLTRETLKRAPEYDPQRTLTSEEMQKIEEYYTNNGLPNHGHGRQAG
jgi:hypothetical protein